MNKYKYLLYVIEQHVSCDDMAEWMPEEMMHLWNKESAFWQLQFQRAVIHAFSGTITLATLPQFSFDDLRELCAKHMPEAADGKS